MELKLKRIKLLPHSKNILELPQNFKKSSDNLICRGIPLKFYHIHIIEQFLICREKIKFQIISISSFILPMKILKLAHNPPAPNPRNPFSLMTTFPSLLMKIIGKIL